MKTGKFTTKRENTQLTEFSMAKHSADTTFKLAAEVHTKSLTAIAIPAAKLWGRLRKKYDLDPEKLYHTKVGVGDLEIYEAEKGDL